MSPFVIITSNCPTNVKMKSGDNIKISTGHRIVASKFQKAYQNNNKTKKLIAFLPNKRGWKLQYIAMNGNLNGWRCDGMWDICTVLYSSTKRISLVYFHFLFFYYILCLHFHFIYKIIIWFDMVAEVKTWTVLIIGCVWSIGYDASPKSVLTCYIQWEHP